MAVSMPAAEAYPLPTGSNAEAASGKAGAACCQTGASAAKGGDFDSHLSQAKSVSGQAAPSAGAQPGTAGPGAPIDEAAFQEQMFEGFAKDVKPEVLERLSAWLPDMLNGGKKELKEAAKGMSKEEAADLKDLAKALDVDADFTRVKDRDGFGKIIEKKERKSNEQGLAALKQAYGEHALKASTPHLAPSTSYDTGSTLDATKQAVYEKFVGGLSDAEQERLADWLPDVLFDGKSAKKASKKLNDKEEAALEALAKEHGVTDGKKGGFGVTFRKDHYLLENLETAFKRDLALETTAELPSVVDMMLAAKFGENNGDTAAHIDLKDDRILKEAKAIEKEFSDLDRWLPAVLAGRGEMPKDDPEAMRLLVTFADEAGFDPKKGDDLGERAEKALNYLEKQDLIHQSLHPGKDGEDSSFLLFTERFMQSTLAYGAKHGAVDQAKLADAANVAEMLLGPDDGSNAPRELQMAGFQAAVLHRTDERLARPQEVMAASGYINKAETLAEQKSRLVETLLAFHVRENIGTPPMTPLQWAENYADLHPEMLDDLGNRAFNAPTGEKLQIVTQHLGVPGDHKFMIDKKRKVKIENDDLGNVQNFDVDKKKKSFFKKLIDVAVPVIGTVLTFVPGAQAIGMGINAAYSAYKGAEAIKHGDLLGGALSIAGAFAGGAANALSGAAARTAANVANGINVASQGVQTARALEQGDMFGTLAGGLGTAAMVGGGRNFQVAAGGVKTTQSLAQGDFLGAGAGFTGVVGNLARPAQDSGIKTQQAPHTDTSFAFSTISSGLNVADGIQEGNFAQIGKGLAGGIKGIGNQIDHKQRLAAAELSAEAEEGIPAAAANGEGEVVIRQAGFTKPGEVSTDSDQQRTMPGGGEPTIEAEQRQKLNDFANVQGSATPIPSPPHPTATHPNASPQHHSPRLQDQNERSTSPAESGTDEQESVIDGTLTTFADSLQTQAQGNLAAAEMLGSAADGFFEGTRDLVGNLKDSVVGRVQGVADLAGTAGFVSAKALGADTSPFAESVIRTGQRVDDAQMSIENLPNVPGQLYNAAASQVAETKADLEAGRLNEVASDAGYLAANIAVPGAAIKTATKVNHIARAATARRDLEAMLAKAPEAKVEIDTLARDLVARHGGHVFEADVKKMDRALEKTMNDYSGDASAMKDLARNTIIVPAERVDDVVKELASQGANVKRVGPENNDLGYTGVNTRIETQAGITAEVRVNTPEMIYADTRADEARKILGDEMYNEIRDRTGVEGGLGHKFYEEFRSLDKRNRARLEEIKAQSRAYYESIRNPK